MLLNWLKQLLSTKRELDVEACSASIDGYYDLYIAGAQATPVGQFPSLNDAKVHAQDHYDGQHCRIVDATNGQAHAFNYSKATLPSDAFYQGIDITSRIVPSPTFIQDLHARLPVLTQKRECYKNCLLTILQLQKAHPELRYALALIHYAPENKAVGHALIEHEGQFYDPTLEHQPAIQALVSYRLLEVLEPVHLQQCIVSREGADEFEKMKHGQRNWPVFGVNATGARNFEF